MCRRSEGGNEERCVPRTTLLLIACSGTMVTVASVVAIGDSSCVNVSQRGSQRSSNGGTRT